MPEKFDVDCGNGVFLFWTTYQGTRNGAMIIHQKADPPNNNGECWGHIWIEGHPLAAEENRPTWQFNGDFEKPTLSPSILCACGFHGFIENGKWRNA